MECEHFRGCEDCREASVRFNELAKEIRGWAETAENLFSLLDETGIEEEDRMRQNTVIAAVSGLLKLICGDSGGGAGAIEDETCTRRKKEPEPVGPILVLDE